MYYIPQNIKDEFVIGVMNKICGWRWWGHLAAAVGAFWALGRANDWLDASYDASMHPVSYAVGQTGFDGQLVKQYYATMIEKGTLGIYWQTQFIDFAFIVAVMMVGLTFSTFVARFASADSLGQKVAFGAGVFVIVGACFDAMENIVSFAMLSNPTNFADWIAIPYSAFAVIKFALIASGMFTLCAAILLIIVGKLFRRPSIG